jgi:hypothetical protein
MLAARVVKQIWPFAGLSQKGLQRKATCRALFSKLLYLIQCDGILKESDVMSVNELRNVRLRPACVHCVNCHHDSARCLCW